MWESMCVLLYRREGRWFTEMVKKNPEKTDIPFKLTKETQTIRVNESLKKIYEKNVLCHGS